MLNLNPECCDAAKSVFKWELEQILLKAQPTIDPAAKTALLTRQFMRGLPRNMKIKLLEHDPVPHLPKMLFVCTKIPSYSRLQARIPATPRLHLIMMVTPIVPLMPTRPPS